MDTTPEVLTWKSLQFAVAPSTVIVWPSWIYTLLILVGALAAAAQELFVLTCQVLASPQLPVVTAERYSPSIGT